MVSSAPFAMWMVMRLARRQVTVTLDGQAGDELLAGYDHYPYVLLRQLLRERRYAEFAREAWLLRDIVGPLVRRRLARARPARRCRRRCSRRRSRADASRPRTTASPTTSSAGCSRTSAPTACRRCCATRTAPRWRIRSRRACRSSTRSSSTTSSRCPRTRDHPQRMDACDRASGAARRPAPQGRGAAQEDRLHDARSSAGTGVSARCCRA